MYNPKIEPPRADRLPHLARDRSAAAIVRLPFFRPPTFFKELRDEPSKRVSFVSMLPGRVR